MSMAKLAALLEEATIGKPQAYGNMRVYPLRLKQGAGGGRGYKTLDEALTEKSLSVTEVSEGGSVPRLKVKNTGALPVLLVVGEELVGAKQNRVLNTSILVPAESETEIPVSCVEQGRWSYQTSEFSSSTSTAHFMLRKGQTERVTKSLRTNQAYDAVQQEVWAEVARKMHVHRSKSPTGALRDVYEQNETGLLGYVNSFTPPDAEAAIIEIGGKVAGIEVFDSPETLHRLWPKLVRSYALDAIERANAPTQPLKTGGEEAQTFLTAIATATEETYNSVGLGQDVRLSGGEVTGSGLLWEDKIIHASIFAAKV